MKRTSTRFQQPALTVLQSFDGRAERGVIRRAGQRFPFVYEIQLDTADRFTWSLFHRGASPLRLYGLTDDLALARSQLVDTAKDAWIP